MPISCTRFCFCFGLILFAATCAVGQQKSTAETKRLEAAKLKAQIIRSFRATHDGWSSDEVILNDTLNKAFIDDVRAAVPDADTETINWTLINLRKAGKLKVKSTRRNNDSYQSLVPLAEIAVRTVIDRNGVSTDRIMCAPKLRAEFNQEVKRFAKDADLYLARKAAYKLRKARALKPELITRIADWNKKIATFSTKELAESLQKIPPHPGVYIFRDKTGYLYIGQADNLQKRLKTQLDGSHNQSLASYLNQNSRKEISIEIHSFAPDSPAKKVMVRRAYESELIRSRKPRFNILP